MDNPGYLADLHGLKVELDCAWKSCDVRGREGGRRPLVTVNETTSRIPATTLLVSVEPCSEPEFAPPRDLFGHHAACQRGAMFPTRPRPDHCVDHREHRSTLASSVVTQARLPRNVALDPVT
jgi:hypothetical protein